MKENQSSDKLQYLVDDRHLPYPGDQIIDAAIARALHADACRAHAIVAMDQVTGWAPKFCRRCGQWKRLDQYHANKRRGDGRFLLSKTCRRDLRLHRDTSQRPAGNSVI